MARRIALALIAALLMGCGDSDAEISPDELGLSATLEQWRADDAARVVQLAVRNRSRVAIPVDRLQLVAPGFEALPAAHVDHLVPMGPRIDLPVKYGAARCAGTAEGRTEVIARVQTADGARTVRFEFGRRVPLLERIRKAECEQRAILDSVDIGFAGLRPMGEALRGELRMTRTAGTQPVTLVSAGGTVIFGLRPTPARRVPWAQLAANAQRVAVPIEITADRCDPHALIESKKTFIFPVHAALGSGQPYFLPYEPQGAVRAALAALMRKGCGPAT